MFDQGEILLIPVPFPNLSSVKKRPVLVLSNNAHNSFSQDIIVIAITSNLAQKGIEISNNSLTDGFCPRSLLLRSIKFIHWKPA
jgi:mRNA interferase MazF